ncbi:MAG: trypsin-like peptidase domain-containing protein [Bdellovibrionota bacterium]
MKKLLFTGVIILGVIWTFMFSSYTTAQSFVKTPPPMKFGDPLPANLFVELARVINPTVVNISTSATFRGSRQRDPMLDMLERFYGMRPRELSNRPQQMGLGSGFIIREDGLIVTNNHVIEGADIINVQLTENAEKVYEAKLIGSDARTDIALIKIKPDGKLPVAALGNSSEVKVGEWVAAFGNPFGHGHTLSKGIVSSMGRELAEINKVPLLQIDATINPGNSGGPLVNTAGYVIGVNAAIDARGPGIGFVIPIDEVKRILPDLENRGSIRKGYLGVYLGDHSNESASDLDLDDKNRGAVVMRIEPGSPAAKAGLRMYDTILEYNGKKINNSVDLSDTVSDSKIGDKVKMKVMAPNRKTRTVEVAITDRPDLQKKAKIEEPKATVGSKAPFNLGITITDLNDSLRDDWGYAPEVKKPIITGIDRGGLGTLAGLRVGDLILEVNKKEVSTAAEALKLIKKTENSFRVARGNRILVINISA